MNRIFEDLNKSLRCKNNISECVLIKSDEFKEYVPSSNKCGLGNSVYNIVLKDNYYIFSTHQLSKYSITIDFYKPIVVYGYMLEMRENPSGTDCYWAYPNKWNLEASDENENWIQIDEQEGNYLSVRKKLISFDFEKPFKYKKFKLNIESVDNPQKWSAISRFEMIGYITKQQSCIIQRNKINRISLLYLFITLK